MRPQFSQRAAKGLIHHSGFLLISRIPIRLVSRNEAVQLVYRDRILPLCSFIEQIFMESLLYTSGNAVHSNLPVKYFLPFSHFSSEVLAAKSLEEEKAKMMSKFFYQTLDVTTSAASGFSRCLDQQLPPPLRLLGLLPWAVAVIGRWLEAPWKWAPCWLLQGGVPLKSAWNLPLAKLDVRRRLTLEGGLQVGD